MNKLLFTTLALSFVSLGAVAQSLPSSIKAYNIPVCSAWKFDAQIIGNLCMTIHNVVLPDGYAVRDAVSDLEEKINALEARIKALEEKQ